MADDLIDRIHAAMAGVTDPKLRAVMAEVEARLVGADVGAEPTPCSDPPMTSKTYGPSTADDRSVTRARQIKLDDYIPYEGGPNDDVYPADDFLGTGDSDPLGHDALIRR